jgi:hypothetical protein
MLRAVIEDANDGNAFEEGYFLSGAGGIRFTTTDEAAPGNSDCVVAADAYGVTVFTDRQGARGWRHQPTSKLHKATAKHPLCSAAVYVASTSALLQHAKQARLREQQGDSGAGSSR